MCGLTWVTLGRVEVDRFRSSLPLLIVSTAQARPGPILVICYTNHALDRPHLPLARFQNCSLSLRLSPACSHVDPSLRALRPSLDLALIALFLPPN